MAEAPQDPTPLARCKVAASASSPLVTEWPASEKARLESVAARGAVAVQYSGCELKLVDACQPTGTYTWRKTTLATDTVELSDADELWAKLPLGAAALEGELSRSGRLAVKTTVAGQLELTGHDAADLARAHDCSGVTHVIHAISIGTFALLTGGEASAGGSATVAGVGAGAKSTASERVMRTAGSAERCLESTAESPHADCSSPIQLFLRPVAAATNGAAAPAAAALSVEVAFPAPEDDSERWSLRDADGKRLCALPCSQSVPRGSGYYLERADESGGGLVRVDLPARFEHEPGSHVVARYQAERGSPFLSTLTFYGLGIPAAIGSLVTLGFGIAEASSDDPDSKETFFFLAAGMYGGAALGSFLWYDYSRNSKLELVSPRQAKATAAPGPVVRVGPTGVFGSF
ncbi:MAG: hypothetical protein KF718_09815 [Polyangiaceae bacterium]|nr:hypothetical protein [Polyangiaceae bacterium]